MKRGTLHDLSKFAAGLVAADFFSLWWFAAHNGVPVSFMGMTFTSSMVVPGLVFDAVLFLLLVHYGWRIGKTPHLQSRTFFLVAGVIFGVVALAHLMRVFLNADVIVLGWDVPLWLSWVGTAAAAYLSYMSFHLSMARR
jgi:hypothetical protein